MILLTKLTKLLTIHAKMDLLSKFVNYLSHGDLRKSYEFASKTPWKKRMCYSFIESADICKSYFLIVDVSTCLADALLLVQRRAFARFQSIEEFQKGANRQGVSFDTIVLNSEDRGA